MWVLLVEYVLEVFIWERGRLESWALEKGCKMYDVVCMYNRGRKGTIKISISGAWEGGWVVGWPVGWLAYRSVCCHHMMYTIDVVHVVGYCIHNTEADGYC